MTHPKLSHTPPEVQAKAARESVIRHARSELNNESLSNDPMDWNPEDARQVQNALLDLVGLLNRCHSPGTPVIR